MRSIRILSAVLVCLLAVCRAHGQLAGEGVYPLGSFDTKGFDTINLGNLIIHFEIPIVQKKGRGGSDFVYKLGLRRSDLVTNHGERSLDVDS